MHLNASLRKFQEIEVMKNILLIMKVMIQMKFFFMAIIKTKKEENDEWYLDTDWLKSHNW